MNDNWKLAGEELAAVLTAENAALAALDLPRAVALLSRKFAKVATFEALPPPTTGHPVTGQNDAVYLLEHLAKLAQENRQLLDRAIKAQGRVIGVLATLVRQTPLAPRYGARGHLRTQLGPMTFTLSRQA